MPSQMSVRVAGEGAHLAAPHRRGWRSQEPDASFLEGVNHRSAVGDVGDDFAGRLIVSINRWHQPHGSIGRWITRDGEVEAPAADAHKGIVFPLGDHSRSNRPAPELKRPTEVGDGKQRFDAGASERNKV